MMWCTSSTTNFLFVISGSVGERSSNSVGRSHKLAIVKLIPGAHVLAVEILPEVIGRSGSISLHKAL